VFARLARLPQRSREVARALAALGGSVDTALLAELAGVDHDQLAESIDELIDADVLARAEPPDFLHPMLCTAIYLDLRLAQRDAIHLRAARLLADRAPLDLDAIAAHLMATRSRAEPWIAEQLSAAADYAMRRHGPDAASRYLRRALAEPPAATHIADLLVALGEADAARGQPAAAVEALSDALPRIENAAERAKVVRALGQALVRADRAVEAAALLVEAIADLPEDASTIGLQLEADLGVIAHVDARAGHRLASRARRFTASAPAARAEEERLALAGRADYEMNRGTAAAAAQYARLALDGYDLLDNPSDPVFFFSTAIALLYSDHLDDAQRVYDAAIASAERLKQPWAAARARGFLAGVQYRRGALAAAESEARLSLASQPAGTLGLRTIFAGAFLIDTLIDRGKTADAGRTMTELGADRLLPDSLIATLIQHARGRLRHTQGDDAAALADFLECGQRAAEWDVRTPAVANWNSSAAQVLVALGHRDEALQHAHQGVTAARAFGSPRAIGIALTALGQVVPDVEALGEAVAVLRASPARLELARALVAHGMALRRVGRRSAARDALQEGLRAARTCGATPLAALAHEELATIGSRPRKILRSGTDTLTPSELRVARLAATGQTNREIADALILSVRTIETHLARTYQKLNITNRRELKTTLGPGDGK
jgi:DNA-binding CsgD family transcriptional regulator